VPLLGFLGGRNPEQLGSCGERATLADRALHHARVRDPAPLPDDLTRGAFDRAAAERAGLRAGRLRRRDVRRPFHGVQTVQHLGTLRDRCAAYAVRMKPGQSFSHTTAALLLGLPLPAALEEDPDLHVSTVHPAPPPTARGVAGHRLRIEPEVGDLDGLSVVAPWEAWAQLAPLLTVDELIELGDALLWRWKDALPHLTAAASTPGRIGGAKLRTALKEIRPGCASPGETRVRLLLTRAGVRMPELNASVTGGLGQELGRPDLLWRAERVTVEYEGDQHRTDKRQFRIDVERYERFRDDGWTVVRVTADDLVGPRRQALVHRVKALLAA